MIIPFFFPFAGCPNRCSFCNSLSLNTENHRSISQSDFNQRILSYLCTNPDGKKTQIAFYGGCFTLMPVHEQERFLEWAQIWIRNQAIDSIRFSTIPVMLPATLISLYKETGVKIVELGIEIMDDQILRINHRQYTANEAQKAIRFFHNEGFDVGIHLMFGLPGSSFEKEESSLQNCLRSPFDFARLHPTIVFSGTELHQWYQTGIYVPLDLNEAVNRVALFSYRFKEQAKKKVIQTGVFLSEATKPILVAGPYDPAFGDLVSIQEQWISLNILLDQDQRVEVDRKRFQRFFAHRGFFLDRMKSIRYQEIEEDRIEVRRR